VSFPPSVRSWLEQAIGIGILGAIFLGPPLWVLVEVLAGGPLYATREVEKTVTVHYGILPEVMGPLTLWFLFVLLAYGTVTGAFPRRF